MMKKLLQKKQWMMLSLVAALGVAVYLNYYFANEPALGASTPETISSSDVSNSSRDDDHLGEATYVNGKPANDDASDPAKQDKDTNSGESKGDNDEEKNDKNGAEKENYFDKARANRTAAREESVRIIQETLNNVQATAEQTTAGTNQVTAIAENILQESNIENMILAKGFADCVVFIDGKNCQVAVQSADLQPQESLQILEIVLAQSDIVAKNVQITAVAG